ncbi:type II toxin-antitoxin system RatA family toxin [Candidatus Anaplasma sp. TIGMIC]|uniref:type II toxin-antitoxin system RatA family toxin n=1 Tax=Candidatus Anaplasma sp. TIGMIC TaxID=3020713 RepID=UPI00232E1585|nr:type II toxin-antitoxin system RatA family toxin [Candidatus Anaplasma sp. TIGMIC]MDB1135017.1 type II toxin-antitoxin system RatA family toxin [Candidatus Anaplasma sp. TIGMIC]
MALESSGVSKAEVLRFPAGELFSIVLDVEKYPEFLPWCKDVVILSKGKSLMEVDLVAGFMSLEGRYTSHVSFLAPDVGRPGWIRAESSDGVFKTLKCKWSFFPVKEKETLVKFFVDFAFKNKVLQLAFNLASDNAIESITRAFRDRAYKLLG